jgi:hypothetical protein
MLLFLVKRIRYRLPVSVHSFLETLRKHAMFSQSKGWFAILTDDYPLDIEETHEGVVLKMKYSRGRYRALMTFLVKDGDDVVNIIIRPARLSLFFNGLFVAAFGFFFYSPHDRHRHLSLPDDPDNAFHNSVVVREFIRAEVVEIARSAAMMVVQTIVLLFVASHSNKSRNVCSWSASQSCAV